MIFLLASLPVWVYPLCWRHTTTDASRSSNSGLGTFSFCKRTYHWFGSSASPGSLYIQFKIVLWDSHKLMILYKLVEIRAGASPWRLNPDSCNHLPVRTKLQNRRQLILTNSDQGLVLFGSDTFGECLPCIIWWMSPQKSSKSTVVKCPINQPLPPYWYGGLNFLHKGEAFPLGSILSNENLLSNLSLPFEKITCFIARFGALSHGPQGMPRKSYLLLHH